MAGLDDFTSFSDVTGSTPGGLFGDGAVQFGPAFTGSVNQDVLQAGGTLNQAGVPQGGGSWWDKITGSNLGGAPMPKGSAGADSWWNSLFGGGSGGGSSLNDILGLVGKGAGIGSSILGGVAGIQNMNRGAQQQRIANRAEGQLSQLGSQTAASALPLVSAGSSAMLGGALPPELESAVQDWKRKAIADMNSRLASMGITNSTAQQEQLSAIEAQEQALRAQYASGLYSSGLQGVQGAYAPTAMTGEIAAQAMSGSAQQSSALQNSIYKILNS
jgi:hypothetical protein